MVDKAQIADLSESQLIANLLSQAELLHRDIEKLKTASPSAEAYVRGELKRARNLVVFSRRRTPGSMATTTRTSPDPICTDAS